MPVSVHSEQMQLFQRQLIYSAGLFRGWWVTGGGWRVVGQALKNKNKNKKGKPKKEKR